MPSIATARLAGLGALAAGLLAGALARAGEPGARADQARPGQATPGTVLREPKTGAELVLVRGGCYQMGDVFGAGAAEHELPVHEVCVGDFYIGKFEVTRGQWRAVMGPTGFHRGSGANCRQDDCAVDTVTRDEVQEFLDRLNLRNAGGRYRLPTEAEWEYAARSGGKEERYAGGNDMESVSWVAITSGYSSEPPVDPPWGHPVGMKAPNGLGLHDMSGNVYEMVSDWYAADYYARSPRDNPKGPATGTEHVKRGGCAHGDPGNGRTARRVADPGDDDLLGFRLVKEP